MSRHFVAAFASIARSRLRAIRKTFDAIGESAAPSWLDQPPARVLIVLDLGILASLALTFIQLGDPDVHFHVVWTLLAVYAFTSPRLAPVLIRVAISMAVVIVYVLLPGYGVKVLPLEFAEWPLMLLISLIVAVMAQWRRSTSRHYATLYRAASERLLTAQETERKRLALDLHDGVGQTLSSLALALEAVQASVEAGDARPTSLRIARELVASATDEARGLAGRLQPIRLAQRGLHATLRELASRAGVPVRTTIGAGSRSDLENLPADVQLNIYRIVQEALANAVRHSGGTRFGIAVQEGRESICIVVSDNGKGFDPASATDAGLGLASMHDRANVIGASVAVVSSTEGTEIRLQLPITRGAPQVPLLEPTVSR